MTARVEQRDRGARPLGGGRSGVEIADRYMYLAPGEDAAAVRPLERAASEVHARRGGGRGERPGTPRRASAPAGSCASERRSS